MQSYQIEKSYYLSAEVDEAEALLAKFDDPAYDHQQA